MHSPFVQHFLKWLTIICTWLALLIIGLPSFLLGVVREVSADAYYAGRGLYQLWRDKQ